MQRMATRIKLSSLPSALRKQVNEKIKAEDAIIKRSLLKAKPISLPEKMPQCVLTKAVKLRWPEVMTEFNPGIEGRKFRIDLAFPAQKLAIEVDGWQYHGKYKASFQKDRERQNLLVVNGWRVLRFYYKEIMSSELRLGVIDTIEKAMTVNML